MRDYQAEIEAFATKAYDSLNSLFKSAKNKNELYYAMSLMPEFRGIQGPGWNTTPECDNAFKEYEEFLLLPQIPESMRVRVALGFYCHLSEASGFYEVPKNMLRVAGGDTHSVIPFQEEVRVHKITGKAVSPSSGKVLSNLATHSKSLGFDQLSYVFSEAFDHDLRNGYAHADYILWNDGIRLPKKNGGISKIVSYAEFEHLLHKGMTFYRILKIVFSEALKEYEKPKTIRTSLHDDPEMDWTISFNPERKSLRIGTNTGTMRK